MLCWSVLSTWLIACADKVKFCRNNHSTRLTMESFEDIKFTSENHTTKKTFEEASSCSMNTRAQTHIHRHKIRQFWDWLGCFPFPALQPSIPRHTSRYSCVSQAVMCRVDPFLQLGLPQVAGCASKPHNPQDVTTGHHQLVFWLSLRINLTGYPAHLLHFPTMDDDPSMILTQCCFCKKN